MPGPGASPGCGRATDPGLLYDPQADRFVSLEGPGLPLGVDAHAAFTVLQRQGLPDGSIILLGTDGIWETASPAGELFGKARLLPLIRDARQDGAQGLMSRIMEALEAFRGPGDAADDITLVVLKLDRGWL